MSDNNYLPGTFADRDQISIADLILAPPLAGFGIDDVFKLSHTTNSVFERVQVVAGRQRENAQDMNRMSCGNTFKQLQLDAGEQCSILCKGASSNNTWDDVLITRAGGHSDVFFGDFSDQSRDKSHNNRLNNVRRSDKKPIRVRWSFIRASKPVLTNCPDGVDYQYGWSLISTIYGEIKYAINWFKPNHGVL